MKNDAGKVKDDIEATDEIIIEEYGKSDKKPPKAKLYVIRIDKTTFKVEKEKITGAELLKLAGKNPIEQYKLYKKLHGGQREEILPDTVVDLTEKGIERFQTVPLGETEG